ncbi:formin-like protein 20 isoform X2 [Patiria miniata]|uniref:Uncharacterized protein n=1 Tax=Patiria miniata TaxID=46514 RepID=A0A913ZII8_PATMI|nr:formin-like protein 20 isoform X2 [Patiria miniata]
MAFSFSAMAFKFFCIVYLSAALALQTTSAEENCYDFDICQTTTPTAPTSAPTTLSMTANETMPPTTDRTTVALLTTNNGTDVNATTVNIMPRSSTPSAPMGHCCKCHSKFCKKCFGPGEKECTQCGVEYIMDESEGKQKCLPCNTACYNACIHMADICGCMHSQRNCQFCPAKNNTQKHGSCREKTLLEILTIGGVVGIGCGVVLIVVVIVVLCCHFCRKRPPKPVKKDYRSPDTFVQLEPRRPFADLKASDEEHNVAFENQNVDDDVYGNVDNHGNIMMYDRPEHEERSPSRIAPAPPVPVDVHSEPDFGDVYENTVVGEPAARPPMPPPKPSPEVPSDFGGMYGNTEIPSVGAAKFQLKKITDEEPKLPPLPQKLVQEPPQPPSVPTRPWDFAPNRDDLPTRPISPPQRSDSEQEDLPMRAPPPPPTKFSSLRTDVMPPRMALPTPSTKSASLPPHPVLGPTFQGAPVPLPKTPIKKQKKKPLTPKKIVRQIDDDSIREDVEIGPAPARPDEDYGGDYEVTIPQPQQDFGMTYEVVQPSAAASIPQQDYGMSYELVEPPPAPPPKDYGDTYEPVEAPEAEQDYDGEDYGGNYEFVSAPPPQKPRVDISQRKPMALPSPTKPHAPPTKRKPSRGEVYVDPDRPNQKGWGQAAQNNNSETSAEPDFGGEYRNLESPADAGRTHKPTTRPPPALPKKQPIAAKPESVYQQALQLSDDDAPARLFQEEEDSIYQNKDCVGPASRYRNVAQKPTDSSVISGSYIKMQRK